MNRALARYCILRNEEIPQPVLEEWIKEFSGMGLPVQDVVKAINRAAYNQVFGKTQFSDFVKVLMTDGMVFTYAEMILKARKMAKTYIENEKERMEEEEKRMAEANRGIEITIAELDAFRNDLDARRAAIAAEVNIRLDRIEKKLDENVYNYRGVINGERMTG